MKIINPANGELIQEIQAASPADVERSLQAARNAFDKGSWPRLSGSERKKILLRISQKILDQAGELAKIETLNTGKPIKETTFMDVASAAETFRYFAENFSGLLAQEAVTVVSQVSSAEALLQREPIGVCLLIVPWNYPLLIASWKLAQALAAGNTVILKPSSLTPLSALRLQEIILDAGVPEGAVQVVVGSGEAIGKQLCADKRVDLVSFTGSNEVGRRIFEYASLNPKKLLMELGGKSASIVLADADLESAVNGCLCSIFLNQGQMCTAMSRLLIEKDIYDSFLEQFVQKAKRIVLGEGSDFQTQMGPLASSAQREKVLSYVDKAKKEGAKILCGGKIPENPDLKQGFFFEPTVITDLAGDSPLIKEEIFGPLVCVQKFSHPDEAVDLANASDFGLAACVWCKDQAKARGIASKLNAGTIWVNTYGMFFNELPYGGFKQSGFGKELGREGFLEYTRLKNVVIDQSKEAKPLVSYWYGF